jgi:hypothetical protein
VELWDDPGAFGEGVATPYDIPHYLRLLARSVETLLAPFGFGEEPVLAWLSGRSASPRAAGNAAVFEPPVPEFSRPGRR